MKKIILKMEPDDRGVLISALLRLRMVFHGHGDFSPEWLSAERRVYWYGDEVSGDDVGIAQQLFAEMVGLT